ncbi:MAG: dual CXXC motif small (seleno)protein [Candidatus Magnetobacterium sp. LHC-1]|uniref:Uncharacterized protein n=1 Tax=Candidatus Magnetobacterium casense TaxID=1455061 RepID=A0ABS6RTY9_9BACT|nr:dual CXXC motif small (seleno)protein [Candidatus Magnetobacterium casensis]MBF0606111.1 hypothetical protein [Nitrospirota bacterium]MBV6340078.1 hypothetical protein [Candidatus Magnetobacterium casensis]
MKCKKCQSKVVLVIGCTTAFLSCTKCRKRFSISEYINEIDEKTWELISSRNSDRA